MKIKDNLSVDGSVSADEFIGDGAQLTSVFKVDSDSGVSPIFWQGTAEEYAIRFPSGADPEFFTVVTNANPPAIEGTDIASTGIAAGFVLQADGDNTSSWVAAPSGGGLANIVEDLTPQLGGNLDLNGNVITGLEIGTNVQAYSASLDAVTGTNTGDQVLTGLDYEPTKGIDDNYVTDAEKVVIGNTSGTNTGDKDIYGFDGTIGTGVTRNVTVDGKLIISDGVSGVIALNNTANKINIESPSVEIKSTTLDSTLTIPDAASVFLQGKYGVTLSIGIGGVIDSPTVGQVLAAKTTTGELEWVDAQSVDLSLYAQVALANTWASFQTHNIGIGFTGNGHTPTANRIDIGRFGSSIFGFYKDNSNTYLGFDYSNLTQNRLVTFPDKAGTLALVEDNDRVLEPNLTGLATYAIDYSLAETFFLAITQATSLTELNLPSSLTSKVITIHVSGNFDLTYPAGWDTNITGAYAAGTGLTTITVEYVATSTPFYKVLIVQ